MPELKAVMDKFPANSEAQEASYWLGVAHTYLKQYDAAIDDAIDAGFVLEEDREAIQAYARPELVPG